MAKKEGLPGNERRGRGLSNDTLDLIEESGLDAKSVRAAPVGDDLADVPADDEPDSAEHTTIDSGLLERLRASEKTPEARGLSNEPNLVGGSSTAIEDVRSMIDLPTPPAEAPAPKRTGTLVLEQTPFVGLPEGASGISSLGPAFPESSSEPKPSEAPTTAKPSASVYSEQSLELPSKVRSPAPSSGSQPSAEPDAWDGFEDAGDSWSKSGSESASNQGRADARPQKKAVAKVDTNVYKRGAKGKGEEGARLVALDGDKGVEIAVEGDDVTVGREGENGVVVKDPSVSRKHARIVRVGAGYELVDLQSGNGTFVNNRRVADRQPIASGDELRFGNVSFRFLELGDVFKPVDASGAPVLPGARGGLWERVRDNPRVRVLAASGLLVALTLAVAAALYSSRRRTDPARQAQVFNAYLKGVEQFKQRQWASSESYLTAALKMYPEHERSRRYLDAMVVEKRAEEALRAARVAHGGGDLARAYVAALDTEDSVHFAVDGDGLLRSIESAADKRIDAARAAVELGRPEDAARLLDGLEFFEVYRAGLAELRASVGAGKKGDPSRVEGPRPDGRDKKPEEQKSDPQGSTAPRDIKVTATGPFADVILLFADGKVTEALKKIGKSKDRDAEALETRIKKFEDVYDSASREHQGKRYNAAIKLFGEARSLEEKVTGGRSKLAYEVRDKLADAYYLRGIVEFSQQHYAEASRDFTTAMQTSENHAQSSRMLGQLEVRAGEVFREASLAERDPPRAKDLYRTVLKMVPASHELYRKAKVRLDALK